ncbi:MAG: nitrogenase cofactor biosynthesis protein NifB, partial [Campylobacterota bacterium]
MACSSDFEIDNDIFEKINTHPCYSKDAHHHFARIHLAVAPACNIQCNYCNRKYDCSNESRPGVTSYKLDPKQALKKVLSVGSEIKQLSVVGIAGPGDALANPKKTFQTFELLQQYTPDLKLCLSTNGLNIADHIDKIIANNIDHVTVTINSIDTSGKIGSQIYPWVYYKGKRYRGVEGAKLLLQKQLEGIKLLTDNGILVKANSVLIEGVNDTHLSQVAKKLKELGVFLHNIMPLISDPSHGTKFGLDGVPSTDEKVLQKVQKECGIDMNMMTHCKQCRADAVGMLDEDRGDAFTKESFVNKSIDQLLMQYQNSQRDAYRENIINWQQALKEADETLQRTKEVASDKFIAVSSQSKKRIDLHFGSTKEFHIYKVVASKVKFIETKSVPRAYCSGEESCGLDTPIESIKEALLGCSLLLTQKIG